MNDLADILGQNEIVSNIIDEFNKKADKPGVIVLRGDSGTGKSHIAKQIMQEWIVAENEQAALLLEGDISQKDRLFYPFNFGLINAKADFFKKKTFKKGASELAKGIPFAGDFISFIIDQLSEKKDNKVQQKLDFLQPEESEILLTINSLYRNEKILLVADNFHWWDDSSIKLLSLVLTGKLNEVFPFLKTLKVLLVVTDNQIIPSETLNDFLALYSEPVIHVGKINRSKFKKVLRYFGNIKLDKEKEELIYTITNGHLELIKSLFQNVSLDGMNLIDSSADINTAGNAEFRQQFLEKIFSLRLQQLGADAEQVISLLEFASIIGLHFNFEEILCLTKEKEDKLKYIIEKAKEGNLLKSNSIQTSFSHDIIREFFLCRIRNKKSTYYKNFAHCLALLRPAEYFQRGNLLFEAGSIKESLIVYILGYFKCIRDGLMMPLQVINRIEEFGREDDVIDFFNSMKNAYEKFIDGKYLEAKHIIANIEDIYSEVLLAEKYYLLSLCLPKNLNKQDLIESKNCLQNWESLKNSESELWVRIMLTLVSRHAHLNEYDAASTIERKIMMFLSERIRFDSFAEYGINVLRRKASILHISEIACKRTQASLEYFAKSGSPSGYRFPLQYFMALANHSGNLLANGDFENAYDFAQQALLYKNNYPEISFPRTEIPINNFIISGYLSKNLTISQALQLYESLFSNLQYLEGRILLKNNYTIFIAMNGELERARLLIDELNDLLLSTTRGDNYYEYFVGINKFAIHLLNGKKSTAKKLLSELKLKIPQIPDKHFLQRRHELLEIIYRNNKIINPVEWNEYLLKKYPQELGLSWRFFGNGFLFSDMQFWSDS